MKVVKKMVTEQNDNGFKKRIEQAFINNEFITLFFLYPGQQRKSIKSGKVIKVYDESFDFNEVFDGHSTFSYQYLIQVMEGRKQ